MNEPAVFQRDGAHFIPTAAAVSPWAADRLHGGPVFGLLTRALESELTDAELVISRLTFDLFRAVPRAPLELRVEPVQQSSRLALLQAMLSSDGKDCARASALALRTSDVAPGVKTSTPLPGPDDLPNEPLFRRAAPIDFQHVPPGFHTTIQTRWVPRKDHEPLAIWFHLPIPLIAGEPDTPLQRAAALSDFTNAVASLAAQRREAQPVPYINADATLYFWRRPEGEWFGLQEQGADAERGISVTQSILHDRLGPLGRSQQVRLANRRR
jgi:hypothetical protein